MSVTLTCESHIATIVLNRPEVRNAMSRDMAFRLNEIFDQLADDDDVWAVVITGAGEQAFCAGQDLRDIPPRSTTSTEPPPRPAGGWGGITRREFPKPLVAAVNGYALGGGFEIVLACDLVVAEEHAQFGLPEVLRGVAASAGGWVRVARRLPSSIAMEIALTGKPLTASRAFEFGLANRVVPRGEGLAAALELAAAVCAGSPAATQAAKQIVSAAIRQGEEDLFALQDHHIAKVKTTLDFTEGIRAFVEKRPPQWQGR